MDNVQISLEKIINEYSLFVFECVFLLFLGRDTVNASSSVIQVVFKM